MVNAAKVIITLKLKDAYLRAKLFKMHTVNRKWENIHIPLWLLKDSCWMMEWKYLGVAMIAPTVLVAALLAWRTRSDDEFFVNLAILAWISANAFWMCCEFFGFAEYKDYSAIGFVLGAISVSVFYYKRLSNNKTMETV